MLHRAAVLPRLIPWAHAARTRLFFHPPAGQHKIERFGKTVAVREGRKRVNISCCLASRLSGHLGFSQPRINQLINCYWIVILCIKRVNIEDLHCMSIKSDLHRQIKTKAEVKRYNILIQSFSLHYNSWSASPLLLHHFCYSTTSEYCLLSHKTLFILLALSQTHCRP